MRSSMVDAARPSGRAAPSSWRTSCRCGTLRIVTGSSAQQRRAQDRQHRVLGAGNPDFAAQRLAAFDQRSCPRSGARFAGGEGLQRRAHGSRRPCARRASHRPSDGAPAAACRRMSALTTVASKCTPSLALHLDPRTRQALFDQMADELWIHGRCWNRVNWSRSSLAESAGPHAFGSLDPNARRPSVRSTSFDVAASGRRVIEVEIRGLEAVAARIDGAFLPPAS